MLSDERIQYDGKANGQPPTKGDVTSVQELVSADGRTITGSAHTYDVYGRETSETDPVGTRSVTAYSPASGAPRDGDHRDQRTRPHRAHSAGTGLGRAGRRGRRQQPPRRPGVRPAGLG
ncbi:hypothetical protein ACFSTC_39720 [Nonomuraea ferruginea]